MAEVKKYKCGTCAKWFKATAKQERGRCLVAAPKKDNQDRRPLALTTAIDGCRKKWEPQKKG